MRRRMLIRMSLAFALLSCLVAFPATLSAQGPQVVDVTVVLAPPQIDQSVTFEFFFVPIGSDEHGELILRDAKVNSLTYDPKAPADLQFDVRMSLDTQYQIVVDILDSDGNPLNGGIEYYYDSDETMDLAVRPGEKTALRLNLSPRTRVADKGNFLDVWAKTDAITLTLYSAPDFVLGAWDRS